MIKKFMILQIGQDLQGLELLSLDSIGKWPKSRVKPSWVLQLYQTRKGRWEGRKNCMKLSKAFLASVQDARGERGLV